MFYKYDFCVALLFSTLCIVIYDIPCFFDWHTIRNLGIRSGLIICDSRLVIKHGVLDKPPFSLLISQLPMSDCQLHPIISNETYLEHIQ